MTKEIAIQRLDRLMDVVKPEIAEAIEWLINEKKEEGGDLISRQDAIDAVKEQIKARLDWLSDGRPEIRGLDVALCVLEELPTAQLATNLQPTCNQLATDTISRQTAIYALTEANLKRHMDSVEGGQENRSAIRIIMELPSAEPQIIRCMDCKWYDRDKESSYGYCHAMKHCHYSKHWEISIYRTYNEDFFCADAEPKEESGARMVEGEADAEKEV